MQAAAPTAAAQPWSARLTTVPAAAVDLFLPGAPMLVDGVPRRVSCYRLPVLVAARIATVGGAVILHARAAVAVP